MLDTPGILPPQIHDVEVCSKLALTGLNYTNDFSLVLIINELIFGPTALKLGFCSLNVGAIRDCLVGVKELAQYFLAILDSSDEYKKWAKCCINENDKSILHHKANHSGGSETQIKRKRQYPTDHTQV